MKCHLVCLLSLFLGWGHGLVSAQTGSPREVVVTGSLVTLRSEPRIGPNTAIGAAKRGDRLELVEEGDGWYRVRLQDGRPAWLSARYARVEVFDAEPAEEPAPRPARSAPAEVPTVPPAAGEPSLTPMESTQPGGGGPVTPVPESEPPAESPATPSGSEPPAPDQETVPLPEPRATPDALPAASTQEREEQWWDGGRLSVGAVLLAAAGLAAVAFWLRRRRLRALLGGGGPISRGDMALVLSKLDERRREEDDRLSREFAKVRQAVEAGAGEPERVVGRIEELRTAVAAMQQRLNAYSDLLAAQDRKLAALEEENRVLRALLTGTRQ